MRRDFRDWEKDDNFIGNAGRVGKQKARQRLERSERNQRETDDSGHSWFDNKHRRRETAPARSDSGKGPKKISFGASIGKQFIPLPPKPTGLESRLSDRPNKNGREDGRKEKEKARRTRQSDPYMYDNGGKGSRRDWDRDRDSDRRHRGESHDHRPRYKGGYAR